ncbi:response regulator transcription factor [Paenibacillus xerothermodurans]|uniref:Response regulator n=1 Tax=Paenibacillus xerothermodurans TaxID=1977292 RepID=A0A2W1NGD1_PAEXE|nr:response regulator [Paenibacillus xerothermodurans]PZE22141.1 response regulator [Paenibacillus xerothermodurans]
MKVLLVDDKESVVQGLSKHVPWQELGVHAVETALDGLQALDIFSRFRADLVITDIKMPNMGGIELMQRLSRESDSIRFIVLSGYDEFEYAKQAISLGASEYLLKPFNVGELIEIAERVLSELRKLREQTVQKALYQQKIVKSLPALREQYMEEIIRFRTENSHQLQEKWEFAEVSLEPDRLGALVVSIDAFDEISRQTVNEVGLTRFVVKNIVDDCLAAWGRGLSFYSDWNRLTVLANYEEAAQPERVKEDFLHFADYCRDAIERHSKLTVTVGVSSLCPKLRDLPHAHSQASQAVEHIFFFGSNQVIHYEDLSEFRVTRVAYPSQQEKALIDLVRAGQTDGMPEATNRFFECLESKGVPSDIRASCIQLVTVLYRQLSALGIEDNALSDTLAVCYDQCDSAKLPELRHTVLAWFTEAAHRVKEQTQQGSQDLLEQAKTYIRGQSLHSISLSMVAEHVKVSPNYLSAVFKKETGQTFIDYLTDLRLHQAKELLAYTNDPVFEIAERLGYHDRKHFRALFKKKVGVTPSEFRDRPFWSRLNSLSK